jgi:multidrug efflux pump subunit AcrA (membrane-fusion protein)
LAVGVRLAVIAVLLVGSGLIFGLLLVTREQSKVRTDPLPPVAVRTVVAEVRPVVRIWEGFGTVRSMSRAGVAAEVSGRVIERPAGVEPGLPIRAGALLLALDSTDYEVALTSAEQGVAALRAQIGGLAVELERVQSQVGLVDEEVAAAERDLQRTREAVAAGAGSQGEVDQRLSALRRSQRERDSLVQLLELLPSRRASLRAQLAGREAELRLATENLARTRVASPMDGEIQSIDAREGDYVTAGRVVAEVVDLSRVEVPLRLPASAASWLARTENNAEGGSVRLWVGAAVGPAAHVGRITRFSPEADPASRTITVFVEVLQDPTRADRLLPGSFVHGRVATPDPVQRVVLPRRAIRSGRVMLIDPAQESEETGEQAGAEDTGVVRVFAVETGYAIDGRFPEVDPAETEWVVLAPGSTPPPGSRVAVSALEQLSPGVRVRVLSGAVEPNAGRPPSGGEG